MRLMSDLKTMKQSPPEGVSASPLGDDNILVWGGTVFGPDDTAWEGGIFSMRLTFTEQYPDKPPRVRFTSEMVRALATAATRHAAARRSRSLRALRSLPASRARRRCGCGLARQSRQHWRPAPRVPRARPASARRVRCRRRGA